MKCTERAAVQILDWNKDGKFDIFLGLKHLALNVGTKKEPLFKAPVPLVQDMIKADNGRGIGTKGNGKIRGVAIDWDQDGDWDIVSLEEQMFFHENLGKRFKKGTR